MSTKDNTYTNIEKRLYFLSDDVDNSSIGQLTWSILYQIAEDDEKDKKEKDYKREPIKLYINSYGGAVYDMWGLIDVIQNSKTPVYTYCTGYAMSAAFKIFLAGHKRYCYKHSTFMYHQMHYYSSGKYQDHVEDRTEKDLMNKEIEEYVLFFSCPSCDLLSFDTPIIHLGSHIMVTRKKIFIFIHAMRSNMEL